MNNKIILFLLLSMAISACKNSHNHVQDDDHAHDDVKLFITGYNEHFEVFAEADPFVQGANSGILAHFTLLENFKPLTGAKITMSMIVGDQGIRQTLDKPYKPGIYLFQLQPTTTGVARILFDVEYNGENYRLEAGRFRVYDDAHDAIHAAEHFMPDHPAAISFTKEQSWVVHFATAPAESKSMGVVVKTVGEVLPARGDEVILTAQTQGIVRFINNNLYEGTQLQGGEVLLNVSGDALADNNATLRYREARSNFERAEADFERLTTLAQDNIVSQRELLQAKNDYENAKATFESLSRNFSESGQVLKSPFGGYLTQMLVSNGQFVEAGQPLAAVARNNAVVIRAEVQQRYASQLSKLATAHFRDALGETYTLEQLNGSILSVARSLNPQTHLLPVVLKVDRQPHWVAGALLDVYLKTTDPVSRIAVPNTALVEEQGNYFVFVQIHPESFEKREVKVGNTDGLFYEVLQGLEENERIVTRGALLVKMAAVSAAIDPHSGHVH